MTTTLNIATAGDTNEYLIDIGFFLLLRQSGMEEGRITL